MRRGLWVLGLSLLLSSQLSSEVCFTDEEFVELETILQEATDAASRSKLEIESLKSLLSDMKKASQESESLAKEQIVLLQKQLQTSIALSESLRERERFWLMLSGGLLLATTLAIVIR